MAEYTKTTRARLYTRKGKSGRVYYLDYHVEGVRKREALKDDDGNPVTSRKAAQAIADRILDPYRAKDTVNRRKMAAAALRDAEDTFAEVAAASKRTEIAAMWTEHPYVTNTRGGKERRLSETTVRDNESQWKRFTEWCESKGIRHAEQIDAKAAAAFRESLSDLTPNRVNKIVGLCGVMFRLSGLDSAPFDSLRKMTELPNGRRDLTEKELSDVCGKAKGELRTLLAVGLYTGMRLADAALLRWDSVNEDEGTISYVPSKISYKGRAVSVPVHPVLGAILAETTGRGEYVMPEAAATYLRDKAALSKQIQAHFETCGVRTHKPGTGKGTGKRAVVEVGYHSLRHSFVTLCARSRTPLHVVRALVGHLTEAVQARYLHVSGEETRQAVRALPTVVEDVVEVAVESPVDALRTRLANLAASADADALERAIAALQG